MTKNDIAALHAIHPYHLRYIRLTADHPAHEVLEKQHLQFSSNEISQMEALGNRSYAPGKWTVKDLLQHLIDTERIMGYRALRIARADLSPRAGYDEAAFAAHANANQRSVRSLLEELDLVRRANVILFQGFDGQMLRRTGTCSGITISVLALAYLITGHALHHYYLLQQRYLTMLTQEEVELTWNEPAFLPHFSRLNRAWIEKDFKLEPDDRYVLDHAQEAIIAKGGSILYAVSKGEVVGTVALQPAANSELEMIKMAVAETARGKGIGRILIASALTKARTMDYQSLILHSNTEYNAQAVALYLKMGFIAVPLLHSRYQRANIKMEIKL